MDVKALAGEIKKRSPILRVCDRSHDPEPNPQASKGKSAWPTNIEAGFEKSLLDVGVIFGFDRNDASKITRASLGRATNYGQ